MSIEDQIRTEYTQGKTYRQLARKYRKSFGQISKIVSFDNKAILNRVELLEDKENELRVWRVLDMDWFIQFQREVKNRLASLEHQSRQH